MAYQNFFIASFFLFCVISCFSQSDKFLLEEKLRDHGDKIVSWSVPNTNKNMNYLRNNNIKVKKETDNWINFSASFQQIVEAKEKNLISDFYFEYCPPALLDDTARVFHQVEEVHQGESPLGLPYTGKDVIMGVVDAGLDHDHPDFIDSNGNKRLLSYWDHSVSSPTNSPQPYGYGQLWTKSDIDNGIITSSETGSAHGTTVTGIATGNGLGNGENKGMAPEADIVVVKSDFSLPNWTLTIADACDFIFNLADSLNRPAVVNLSLGSYLGSHDGTDPAGEHIASLVDEKPGRIVVCAAGNSGDTDPYHVRNEVTSTPSFVWFENNPSGQLGDNTIFFDLWSDLSEAGFQFSFGANNPNQNYQEVATTASYNPLLQIGSTVFDTLRNSSNDILATIEVYFSVEADNLRMQVLFSEVDSTDYYYSFKTQGNGSYDLWSGLFLNLNKIVEDVPSSSVFPDIENYVFPDSLQSIVSSWACSENVITVANLRGRKGHVDKNGNYYIANYDASPGDLAPSSSKGPTRKNVIKPDVSAMGDLTLGAAPAWLLNNPANNANIDEGGLHARNGGTSMASPVVAGVAALYLEQCNNGTWEEFQSYIFNSSTSDTVYGALPNNAFGYGKLNGHALLVEAQTDKKAHFFGDTVICDGIANMTTLPEMEWYNWSSGDTSSEITLTDTTTISVFGRDLEGCMRFSDTLSLDEGIRPIAPEIKNEDTLYFVENPNNYMVQWYFNDSPIPDENSDTLYPIQNGFYSVSFTNEDGCLAFSNATEHTLNLNDFEKEILKIYPNPAKTALHIEGLKGDFKIYDALGRAMNLDYIKSESGRIEIDVSSFSRGVYILKTKSHSIRFVKE